MKVANVAGRAALVFGNEVADVAEVSDGRFGPDPMDLLTDWTAFKRFAQKSPRLPARWSCQTCAALSLDRARSSPSG